MHAFRSELAKYHSDTKEGSENAHATYLITGVSRKPPRQRPSRNEDAMDVDEEARDESGSGEEEMDDDNEDSDEGEDVDETTVMLIGESGLESMFQSPRIMRYSRLILAVSLPRHRIQGTFLARIFHYRVQSVTRTTACTSQTLTHTSFLVLRS